MSTPPLTGLQLLQNIGGSGTVTLPFIAAVPGNVLIFQDLSGTFGTAPVILSTSGNDRFPNNNNKIELNVPYETLTIVGASDRKWYPISAQTYEEIKTSKLTVYSTIAFKLNHVSSQITTNTNLDLLFNNQPLGNSVVYFENLYISTAFISTLRVGNLSTLQLITNEFRAPIIQQQINIIF